MKGWTEDYERRRGARSFVKPIRKNSVDITEYIVYHSKYLAGSTQNDRWPISESIGRYKEALGRCKMQFKSQLQVMEGHNLFGDTFHILPNYFVVFGHEGGRITYYHRFYLVRVERTVNVDSSRPL